MAVWFRIKTLLAVHFIHLEVCCQHRIDLPVLQSSKVFTHDSRFPRSPKPHRLKVPEQFINTFTFSLSSIKVYELFSLSLPIRCVVAGVLSPVPLQCHRRTSSSTAAIGVEGLLLGLLVSAIIHLPKSLHDRRRSHRRMGLIDEIGTSPSA